MNLYYGFGSDDMPRSKKDYQPFSMRMDREVFERLSDFCEKSGQMKTVAVERAIKLYIDTYEEQMRKAGIIYPGDKH